MKHLPSTFYVGDGLAAEMLSIRPNQLSYKLTQLMNDEPIGQIILFRRNLHSGTGLWISTHRADGSQIAVEQITGTYNLEDIKKWIRVKWEPLLESTDEKYEEPDWLPFSVKPISGKWPVSRHTLWLALDDAWGSESWQLRDVTTEHRYKWKNNLPITYVHHKDAKLDYKKLKLHGFDLHFL